MKKIIVLILVLGVGAGAYFYWEGRTKDVIPAQAGIQKFLQHLDPGLRRGDEQSHRGDENREKETQEFLQKKGSALYKERHFRTQIAAYEAVLRAAPQSEETKKKLADLHYEIGKLALENGDPQKAKTELETALKFVPGHTEAKKTLLHIE